jgi:thiol-disulfide isomerase/thioredoxin
MTSIRLTMAALLAALALGASGAGAQIPPAGYTFQQAAPCIEDEVAARKPRRPSGAVYAVCADQMAILAKGLADAKAQNKLLMVTFGATWCPWCAFLQKALPGPELLGHKSPSLDLGRTYHHIEIALSTIHKGAKAKIPSGEAALALILQSAPGVNIRAIPFLAVIDPKDASRVFARNMDDVALKDHTYDLAKVRGVLAEAHAVLRLGGERQSEPGWIARKWRQWWGG